MSKDNQSSVNSRDGQILPNRNSMSEKGSPVAEPRRGRFCCHTSKKEESQIISYSLRLTTG